MSAEVVQMDERDHHVDVEWEEPEREVYHQLVLASAVRYLKKHAQTQLVAHQVPEDVWTEACAQLLAITSQVQVVQQGPKQVAYQPQDPP